MTKTYLLQKILKSCFAKTLCSHLCSLLLLVASCNGTGHGSNYRKAVEGLGFTEKRQASSLLKVLYMNEHLSEHLVTEAICAVKILKKENATIEHIYESDIGVLLKKSSQIMRPWTKLFGSIW